MGVENPHIPVFIFIHINTFSYNVTAHTHGVHSNVTIFFSLGKTPLY